MKNAFTLQVSPEGIGELKFDLPNEKVNKINTAVMDELEQIIDKLSEQKDIKVLKIVSGKEGVFIAGADLETFIPAFKSPQLVENLIKNGHRVFGKLSSLPFPTVAIIDGACLGGGLELALSCTYRVVTDNPKTQLGLPEVTLGIIPGWGGTQRLPRLVGLSEGTTMILTGKGVNGVKAYKLNLADAIVAAPFVKEKGDQFAKSILTQEGKKVVKERRSKKGFTRFLLEDNPLGRSLVFSQAKKGVLEKTKGHYPAPLVAIDVIREGYSKPLPEALKFEADTFCKAIPNDFKLAKNLIGLFFTNEALKKETGSKENVKPKEIKSAAVLGAGTMGAGIAWLLADKGIFVRLKDISWDLVGKGLGVVKELLKKGVKAKKVKPCEADRRFQLVSGSIDYSGFQHADIVIEAATENLELKKKIFAEVEAVVRPNALIVSNTSSLTIDSMAQGMKHPERFVGMHFFNPVPKMPLVEVVAGSKTSPEALVSVVALCRKLGKTPIVVGDCPGFLVNRVFMQSANEIIFMLEEGYSKDHIIKAALDFGMPMDPFELIDEVGVDVTNKVSEMLEKGYGDRMKPPTLLKKMIDKGYLGKKNGKGFYLYKGKEKTWNPEVDTLLREVGRKKEGTDSSEILPRFLYTMINESARCLDEKIITRPDYLDMALITGIGFPPFQGGLLKYADTVGTQRIVEALNRFEKAYGQRFVPAPYLVEMAKSNKTFYS